MCGTDKRPSEPLSDRTVAPGHEQDTCGTQAGQVGQLREASATVSPAEIPRESSWTIDVATAPNIATHPITLEQMAIGSMVETNKQANLQAVTRIAG